MRQTAGGIILYHLQVLFLFPKMYFKINNKINNNTHTVKALNKAHFC